MWEFFRHLLISVGLLAAPPHPAPPPLGFLVQASDIADEKSVSPPSSR